MIFSVGYPCMQFVNEIIVVIFPLVIFILDVDAHLLIVQESCLPPFLFWELSN